jgi:hypothetical protein
VPMPCSLLASVSEGILSPGRSTRTLPRGLRLEARKTLVYLGAGERIRTADRRLQEACSRAFGSAACTDATPRVLLLHPKPGSSRRPVPRRCARSRPPGERLSPVTLGRTHPSRVFMPDEEVGRWPPWRQAWVNFWPALLRQCRSRCRIRSQLARGVRVSALRRLVRRASSRARCTASCRLETRSFR